MNAIVNDDVLTTLDESLITFRPERVTAIAVFRAGSCLNLFQFQLLAVHHHIDLLRRFIQRDGQRQCPALVVQFLPRAFGLVTELATSGQR